MVDTSIKNIEKLIDVMDKFSLEIGGMRHILDTVQKEFRKQVTCLREEIKAIKTKLDDDSIKDAIDSKLDMSANMSKERIANLEALLKVERQRLKEASMNIVEDCKTPNSYVPKEEEGARALRTPDQNDNHFQSSQTSKVLNFDYSLIASPKSKPKYSLDDLVFESGHSIKRKRTEPANINSSPKTVKEWWRETVSDEQHIDWDKEFTEREELKYNLMVKEGWKISDCTYEELEQLLEFWMGSSNWKTIKKSKSPNNGKPILNVKFNRLEDRERIYTMRNIIADQGLLSVSEALSFVERKERRAMLTMFERLKSEGRDVVFEDKRIRVDRKWWRYDWRNGWQKL